MRLSSLGTSATNWPIVPALDDNEECGAIGEMRIGRGIWSTRRKPAPMPLCPPQIPHDMARDRTLEAAVGSRLLTAWAMAWPNKQISTVKPVLNGNIFRSRDLSHCTLIKRKSGFNGKNCSRPLRFRLRQVLLYHMRSVCCLYLSTLNQMTDFDSIWRKTHTIGSLLQLPLFIFPGS
jgi:hypothetical protein